MSIKNVKFTDKKLLFFLDKTRLVLSFMFMSAFIYLLYYANKYVSTLNHNNVFVIMFMAAVDVAAFMCFLNIILNKPYLEIDNDGITLANFIYKKSVLWQEVILISKSAFGYRMVSIISNKFFRSLNFILPAGIQFFDFEVFCNKCILGHKNLF